MVRNGQAIRQVTYLPPGGAPTPVETMSFGRLRQLDDGRTQRADFHVLAFVRRGRGTVSADFADHELGPGSVTWIQPGVVHRWADVRAVDGELVLFVPAAPISPGARALVTGVPTVTTAVAGVAAWRALGHLRYEYGLPDAGPEVLRLLLSALLLRLEPHAAGGPPDGTFERFRRAVEEDFRDHHDVGHYARRLGYSERTLSRAALGATGRTAKDFLVERLVLEAKRLLVHDRLTPAGCGRRLGFSDASNFSAFFVRNTGVRPGAWQGRRT